MGLLDSAKNLIKSAYNKIVGTTTDKKVDNAQQTTNKPAQTQTKKQPNSIMTEKGATTGSLGDTVEISSKNNNKTTNKLTQEVNANKTQSKNVNKNNNNKQTAITDKDIEKKALEIKEKCKKFGITFEEVKKFILETMNFTEASFNAETKENQLRILCCIDAALSMQIIYKEQGDLAEDINQLEYLGLVADNYMNAIENGKIEDVIVFQKNIDKALDSAYKKLQKAETIEEKAEILNELRESINQETRTEYTKKLKGKTKSEQAKLNKELEAREECNERALELGIYRKAKPEDWKDAVFVVKGKNMAKVYENSNKVANPKIRSVVADSQTHEFGTKVLEIKHNQGDDVPAAVYGEAIEFSMARKTAEAAREFEEASYEYRLKIENGEIDAPWMTQEHLTAESTAIGVGITTNNTMSTQDKAELLDQWDKHASEFNDYCEVKEAYNNTIGEIASQNPYTSQGIVNVKQTLKEEYNNDIEKMPRAWEKRKENKTDAKPRISEAELKTELKNKSVSEIKKSYSNSMHEIAKIVLRNDTEYKNRVNDILDYLKGFSGKEIGLMAIGCSTPTISKIIQAFPEKANEILDIVAPSMCFAGKQTVERIAEKGQKNEVA